MSPRKRWHLIFIMNEKMICSFFGHREVNISDELRSVLKEKISKVISMGCQTFYFGGYGDFDALCYETVSIISKENPHLNIKKVYCVSQEKYLRKKVRYFNPEDYDEVIYLTPSFDGWYKSIYFY